MFNPDRMVRIGEIPDLDFSTDVPRRTPVAVRRDNDLMILPAAQLDLAGVRELENVITKHRNAVARYRLRELDLDDYGIDVGDAREDLAGLLSAPALDDLEDVDWADVSGRLERLLPYGGVTELRRLSSLLSCDDPAKWCNCVISGGLFLPVACHLHGVPCEECGGLAGCKPGCGDGTPADVKAGALGVLIAREEDGRGEGGGDCGCGLGADRCRAAEDGDFGD